MDKNNIVEEKEENISNNKMVEEKNDEIPEKKIQDENEIKKQSERRK